MQCIRCRVAQTERRASSVCVWRQKPVICSAAVLEIIIFLGVTSAVHCLHIAKQPYAKLQKLYLYIYFCVYFAFCSLFYSHCVAHFRFFFFSFFCRFFVFFAAIQLKCTLDIFVLILLSLFLLLFRFISPTFASFCTISSIWMCSRWKANRNFASMRIQRRLCSGGHFIAHNKCADCVCSRLRAIVRANSLWFWLEFSFIRITLLMNNLSIVYAIGVNCTRILVAVIHLLTPIANVKPKDLLTDITWLCIPVPKTPNFVADGEPFSSFIAHTHTRLTWATGNRMSGSTLHYFYHGIW